MSVEQQPFSFVEVDEALQKPLPNHWGLSAGTPYTITGGGVSGTTAATGYGGGGATYVSAAAYRDMTDLDAGS